MNYGTFHYNLVAHLLATLEMVALDRNFESPVSLLKFLFAFFFDSYFLARNAAYLARGLPYGLILANNAIFVFLDVSMAFWYKFLRKTRTNTNVKLALANSR
jgi:hypothetical protein